MRKPVLAILACSVLVTVFACADSRGPSPSAVSTPSSSASASATARVQAQACTPSDVETKAPLIKSISATPSTLWPPNHKLVPVTVSVTAVSQDCPPEPVACKITKVASNEGPDPLGDGNDAPDWKITGALTVDLAAERSGLGDGRIYTITVTCAEREDTTPPTTLTTTATTKVMVPHDQGSN